MSSLKRCRECGSRQDRKKRPVEIAARGGVAYWRGVRRCASIHACPVCGAKIRNGRSLEISGAAAEWIKQGNEVWMVTLTAPHDLGMPLAGLLVLISNAFRFVIAGRAWSDLKDELGIAGTVRSLEVTYGTRNGWHPHLHVLVFVHGCLDARGIQRFDAHFRNRWHSAVAGSCRECGRRQGRGKLACACPGLACRPPHPVHGVRIERCYSGDGAAEYICKTQDGKNPGNEMARADMKSARDGHQMPFDLLEAAAAGDGEALVLWHEYEQATFRHQAITWSKHLRLIIAEATPDRAASDEDWMVELTDEDLAAADVEGAAVARVAPAVLRQARRLPGFRVALLEAFEDGGIDALVARAAQDGFEASWPPGSVIPLIVPVLDES